MNTARFSNRPTAHYVDPMGTAVLLAPWVSAGAAALMLVGLSATDPGQAAQAVPIAAPVRPVAAVVAVRHVTLNPVEVIGRREPGTADGLRVSRAEPAAGTLEP